MSQTIDHVEQVIRSAFDGAAPSPEEILRHKWLESEKAGHDIGLGAAVQDWQAKHYQDWKLARSMRRTDILFYYVLLPLAGLMLVSGLMEVAGFPEPVDALFHLGGR